MIDHQQLLKSAAQEIDDADGQIAKLNGDKKDNYDRVKESVGAADYKAWRAAVKLRQKRRLNRAEMEEQEARVAEMLFLLEAQDIKGVRISPVAPSSVSAKGILSAPTRAGADGSALEYGQTVNDGLGLEGAA